MEEKNMKNRWNKTPSPFNSFEEKEKFLLSNFKGIYAETNSYHIKGLNTVLNEITKNIDAPIRICGDYDVDGITSTAELFLLLTKGLGAKDVKYYLPKRFSDGYGLSEKIINTFLKDEPPGLLITVDNGIAAGDAIQYAKNLKWTVIILDHHIVPTDEDGNRLYPNADIIIDPKAIPGSSNFTDYCAAGIVYKLSKEAEKLNLLKDISIIPKITSFATLGTVCDNVLLIEQNGNFILYDNYILVKEGLHTILQNEGRTTGLYCLLRALNKDINISETDIGFSIGPTMNALSRLEDSGATTVLELLLSDDNNFNECDTIAQKLRTANDVRKELTATAVPVFAKRIEENHMENDYPIVVTSEPNEVHPGLIGLIAAQLCEKYKTPVVLLAPEDVTLKDGADTNILHGSARAPAATNIKDILDHCSSLLIKYGGHAHAAGVTMDVKNVNKLRETANAYTLSNGGKPEELYNRYYDFEISTKEIAENIEAINKSAPYGMGHPAPVYRIKNFILKKKFGNFYKFLGASGNSLKLNGYYADAICFTPEISERYKNNHPLQLNLYGTLGINKWNGEESNQIIFNDYDV